jgi:hypothetical protein
MCITFFGFFVSLAELLKLFVIATVGFPGHGHGIAASRILFPKCAKLPRHSRRTQAAVRDADSCPHSGNSQSVSANLIMSAIC